MAIARALASDEEEEDGSKASFEGEEALMAPLGAPFDRVCTITMETLAVASTLWGKGAKRGEKATKTDEEEMER